jgi:hypothetical protein
MGKLHELLAVEKGLEVAATDAVREARDTFTRKQNHFLGAIKRYEPFDEAKRHEEATEEFHEMETTVPAALERVMTQVAKWFDAVLQKEATNQTAKADVVVRGRTLARDLPATFLLGLESKLRQLRQMVQEVPVLSPGTKWEPDATRGKGVIEHKIIVPATKEHPAQVEKWNADQNIGRYITEKWSGMASPADKAALLERLGELERAVKQARQRANAAEVLERQVGEAVAGFLLEGELPDQL